MMMFAAVMIISNEDNEYFNSFLRDQRPKYRDSLKNAMNKTKNTKNTMKNSKNAMKIFN
ncbi:hypothetical protein HanIR_Chr17g0878871 [Helianthus annuus]|nr:hypothetical protein HanIR_Chr17g0878871 [Helianthus annuus]